MLNKQLGRSLELRGLPNGCVRIEITLPDSGTGKVEDNGPINHSVELGHDPCQRTNPIQNITGPEEVLDRMATSRSVVVPGYPNYLVSDTGDIFKVRNKKKGRNYATPRPVKVFTTRAGYKTVNLRNGEGSRTWGVSQVVAKAFCGPCPEGYHVAHLNGNRIDNRAINLAFVHPAQNADHRCMHDTYGRKLQRRDILGIYAFWDLGATLLDLAERYQVTSTHLWNIVQGKSWRPLHRGMGRLQPVSRRR